eukprot:m.854 g.854  ORF g.854 m.854 type:complete len:60 (+) comp334_c1_seq1:109-288(+)
MFSEKPKEVFLATFRDSDHTAIVVPNGVHTIGRAAEMVARYISHPPSARSLHTPLSELR